MRRNFIQEARLAARDVALQLRHDIAFGLTTTNGIGHDICIDYPQGQDAFDSLVLNREFNNEEAQAVMEQLSQFKETDESLWRDVKGASNRKAVQALHTFANAVEDQFVDLVKQVEAEVDPVALRDEAQEEVWAEIAGQHDDPSFRREDHMGEFTRLMEQRSEQLSESIAQAVADCLNEYATQEMAVG